MQTLVAFGGIGGLALAFASQQVIANFFGGVMVYVTRPFTIGENVIIPEKNIEGRIEQIGWYMTRIRNPEKRPIYVPNSIFTQTIVMTPSRKSHERFHHTIGLTYSDIHLVQKVVDDIKLMISHHAHIDKKEKIEVFLISFEPASLLIEISAFITASSIDQFSIIRQQLLLDIAQIVEKNGAKIALPTNTVELKGLNLRFDPSKEPA